MVFACESIFARTLLSIGPLPAVALSSARMRKAVGGFRTLPPGREAGVFAQVGEWLKPADCKSAPPCEVRRFESFPVHQVEAFCGREPAAEIPSVVCQGSQ